jgi:hypothetical protein
MKVPSTTSTLTTEAPGSTTETNVPSTTSTLTIEPPGSSAQTNVPSTTSTITTDVVSVEKVDSTFV